jgi:hypothetical protein
MTSQQMKVKFKVILTTDGQSASLSRCQAHVCGPDFYYRQKVAGLLMWGTRLQLLLVLVSRVILGFEPRATLDHILLSQSRDFLKLEGHVPVFISLKNRVDSRHWVPFPSPPTTRRGARGRVVVKALCCKPEGRGFNSRWGGFFKLT